MLQLGDGEGRDRVHHQQRRMAGLPEHIADLFEIACHAGRRVVVHDHDRLDLVTDVGVEHFEHGLGRESTPWIPRLEADVESPATSDLRPRLSEEPLIEGEHLVAG